MPENWETYTKKELVPLVKLLIKNFEQSLSQIKDEISNTKSVEQLHVEKTVDFNELMSTLRSVRKLIETNRIEHETNRLLMETHLQV